MEQSFREYLLTENRALAVFAMDSFMKGKITLKQLKIDSGGTELATKSELSAALKNKFMLDMAAEGHGITVKQFKSKIQELMTIL